jgi:hypothetical protein
VCLCFCDCPARVQTRIIFFRTSLLGCLQREEGRGERGEREGGGRERERGREGGREGWRERGRDLGRGREGDSPLYMCTVVGHVYRAYSVCNMGVTEDPIIAECNAQGLWETMAQRPIEGKDKESGDQWLEDLSRGKRTANRMTLARPVNPQIAEILSCTYPNPYKLLAAGNFSVQAGDLWLSANGKKMVKKGAAPHFHFALVCLISRGKEMLFYSPCLFGSKLDMCFSVASP